MNTSRNESINTITNSPLSPGRSRFHIFTNERSPLSTMTAFQQSGIVNPQRGDDDPPPFSKENSMAHKPDTQVSQEQQTARTTLKIMKVPSPAPKLMMDASRDFTFAENPKHIVQAHLAKISSELQSINQPNQLTLFTQQQEYLPQAETDKKLLLLDLEETILFVQTHHTQGSQQITLKKEKKTLWVQLRPNIHQFLEGLQQFYAICVFSSCGEVLTRELVKLVDPKGNLIIGLFSKENCVQYQGIHVKDLRLIKNYSLQHMVIVDKSILSFFFQLENGIPILPWRGNEQDDELMPLQDFLIALYYEEDIRVILRHHYDLKNFLYNCE